MEAYTIGKFITAMRTGWGSSSYFTKMFHSLRGKNPNTYRKEYRALQKQALE